MNTDTVDIDGKTMTKDAAIEHLQGKLAATEALRRGLQVDDAAARLEAARAMGAFDRQRKADESTGYGAYVQRISNAWKTAGKVA